MAKKTRETEGESLSRRDEILQVAAVVFAERGIKEATVRDIGDAAGILSGSLYYHFDSKEQIVLDVLLPSVEVHYERCVAIVVELDGVAALTELIRATLESTAENPHRSIILRNGAQVFGEVTTLAPVAEVLRKIIRLWFEVVEQGVIAGELRSDIDSEIAVRAMIDGTLGASRWFTGSRRADPAHVAETLISLYVAGVQQVQQG